MQTHLDQPAAISVTVELIKALDSVVSLAEGNCLDLNDPDREDDPDLLIEANSQLAAIDTVNAFLSLLVSRSLPLGSDKQG